MEYRFGTATAISAQSPGTPDWKWCNRHRRRLHPQKAEHAGSGSRIGHHGRNQPARNRRRYVSPRLQADAMRRSAARSDAMTAIGMEDGSTERTQRIYARVAGFGFLWLIVTGLAGALTTSRIAGSGTFAEIAKRDRK